MVKKLLSEHEVILSVFVSNKYRVNSWLCVRKRQSTDHPVAKILQNKIQTTATNNLKENVNVTF